MSFFKIDERVLDSNKLILGDELGIYYSYLYNDIISLIYEWNEYKELFNKSQTRIDIINKKTGSFFWLIQKTLLENIILAICRLTDEVKPTRIDKKHLSIYILPKSITDIDFRNQIHSVCSQIRKSVSTIREQRDNYIAHTDLNTIINRNAILVKFDDIEKCIRLLFQVIETMSLKYFGTDIAYDVIGPPNGARSVIQVLAEGLEYREQRERRLLEGKYTEDDLKSIHID